MSNWDISGPGEWRARWPHFSPDEFACSCCGELPPDLDTDLLDRLELLRKALGTALKINSGHRCRQYNLVVGGAAYSQHKNLAVDVSLHKHDSLILFSLAKELGFLGIGLGDTFIHLDMRRKVDGYQPPRKLTIWYYSKAGKAKWEKLLKEGLTS